MHKTTLFQVLRKLTTEESRIVTQFLTIPFFNGGPRKQKAITLWQYIQKYKPAFDDAKLHRETVCQALDIKSEEELRKITAELLAVVRKSLFHIAAEQQTDAQKHALLTPFYIEHNLMDEVVSSENTAIKSHKSNPHRDDDYYHQGWLIEESKFQYQSFLRNTPDLNLPIVGEHLDLFYISNKLLNEARVLIFGAIEPIQAKDNCEALIAYIKLVLADRIPDFPLIVFLIKYIELFRVSKNADITEFEELIDYLSKHASSFSIGLSKELHSCLRVYAAVAINNGSKYDYLNIQFSLLKEHLDKGLLYNKGGISSETLQNIALSGLKLGYTDWVIEVLEKHRTLIRTENNPAQVHAYIWANCLFYQHRYQDALDSLPDTFVDFQMEIFAKVLRIKCFYELESNQLAPAIETLRINDLLRNQKSGKIAERFFVNMGNLIKTLNAIMGCIPGSPKLEKLLIQVNNPEFRVAERPWLLEKIQAKMR